MGAEDARIERDFKQHKRRQLAGLLEEYGLARAGGEGEGGADGGGGGHSVGAEGGGSVTVAEMIYRAEASAHSQVYVCRYLPVYICHISVDISSIYNRQM